MISTKRKINSSTMLFCFRKVYKVFIISFILGLISCENQALIENHNTGSLTSEAKDWFTNEILTKENALLESLPKLSPLRTYVRMNALNKLLDWEQSKSYKEQNTTYIIVPVRENIKPFANQKVEAVRSLIFYKAENDTFHLNVIEIINNKSGSIANKNIQMEIINSAFLKKQFSKKEINLQTEATALVYDENYKPIIVYQINNGKLSISKSHLINRKGFATPARVASTLAKQMTCGCTTYYTVGYWFDLSTGQILGYEILDQNTVCPGGPNDGPGYGPSIEEIQPPDCSVVENDADALVESAQISDETVNIATVSTEDNSRTKTYEWLIMKGIGWNYKSTDTGVHEKTNNGPGPTEWKWKSLTHNSVSPGGITVGGSITYQEKKVEIEMGQYNTIIAISFTLGYSLVCQGGPVTRFRDYKSPKVINVNDND